MIHFGLKKLENKFYLENTDYFHFAVFLGIGNQFGTGECILSLDRMNYFLGLEKFLTNQFSKYVYNGPERFWHFLHHLIPNDSDIIRALDMASRDLHLKLNGKKIHNLYNNQEIGNDTNFITTDNPSIAIIEIETINEIIDNEMIQHCIITDSISNFDTIEKYALNYPSINFFIESNNFTPSQSNIFPYIHFEKTQGISDIFIRFLEKNLYLNMIYTSTGSVVTMRMLSSLIKDNGLVLMNSIFTDVETTFKNIKIENPQMYILSEEYFGHGILI